MTEEQAAEEAGEKAAEEDFWKKWGERREREKAEREGVTSQYLAKLLWAMLEELRAIRAAMGAPPEPISGDAEGDHREDG